MKKTLIALAVAASAAVSGSAMAWTANGAGGSVDLGGTLTPTDVVTPWEVKTGAAVNGLDAEIAKGQQKVELEMPKNALILGIRTKTNDVFLGGKPNINPQIDFHNAVDIDAFVGGKTTLTLDVTQDGNKIGTMKTSFESGAEASFHNTVNENDTNKYSLYASDSHWAFFGGLGKNAEAASKWGYSVAKKYDAEVVANYNEQGISNGAIQEVIAFNDGNKVYSGFYGAGIPANSSIVITLDQAASGDAPIQWKASLPVTVSYQ